MGADRHKKLTQRERLAPFVPMLKETLDAPAWRAMSHGARSLYTALKRRYNQNSHNNGRVFISQRIAANEIGSHHNEVARWFRELQHYGFIVKTTGGCLGVDGKGKAPHWRLTELGYMHERPRLSSCGGLAGNSATKKIESRAGNGARSVQEMAHTIVPEMAHPSEPNRAGNGVHKHAPEGAGNGAHTKSTTRAAGTKPSIPISAEFVQLVAHRRGGTR
jgi:hypothetical protein